VPDIEKKLNQLEARMNALTTESIDSRVKTLEKAMNTGALKPEDVADLNELRSELMQLKGYMFKDPREVVEFKQLQNDYRNLAAAQSQFATKDAITTVQWILGLGLGFFGILFTIFFGSWWFAGRKSTPQPTKPVTSPVSPSPAAEAVAPTKKEEHR